MKQRMIIVASVICVVLISSICMAQVGARRGIMQTDEILSITKRGQWVKLEGKLQKDQTIICYEVEIMTGDFLDDDWEVVGAVQSIDPEKKEFRVGRLLIKLHKDAEFENPAGTFKSFKDLKEGLLVEVEGTYLKDNTFMALEVEDESYKLREEPELSNQIEAVGKVERVDPKTQTMTLMGMPFQLNSQTKGKSVIK